MAEELAKQQERSTCAAARISADQPGKTDFTTSIRVAEFYAGIGGFHYAFLESGLSNGRSDIVASIDINTNTTAIYAHNFPETIQLRRNICGMTAQDLDNLKANVFFLSPPCQPFTRQGSKRDNQDRRTDSFFHVMHSLKEMHSPPHYLLMENVKGFEGSNTRGEFVSVLNSLDYVVQEFLLSPTQFGILNSRLRYYLLAKKKPLKFALQFDCDKDKSLSPITDAGSIIQMTSSSYSQGGSSCAQVQETQDSLMEKDQEGHLQLPRRGIQACKDLSHYLENLDEETIAMHLVPDKILSKYAIALDIVRSTSQNSCCFTKGYGNYAVGTGSVLQHSSTKDDLQKCFEEFEESSGDVKKLQKLNLRYFTPREVANLMCFPSQFSFPEHLTTRQCYMALGNSLNVTVVSHLIRYLFL